MAELAAGEGRGSLRRHRPLGIARQDVPDPPRADWRLRAGHAVEFSRGHSRLERLPRPDLRQHGGAQAGFGHSALREFVRVGGRRDAAGVINLVQGRGSVVGEAMCRNPHIALISITGSTETGKHVAAECGRTGKRVSLECGGKNAEIVMDDANLDFGRRLVRFGAPSALRGNAAPQPAG